MKKNEYAMGDEQTPSMKICKFPKEGDVNTKKQPVALDFNPESMVNIEAGVNIAYTLKLYSYQNKEPVKGIALELNQVPSEQNGNTAVVTSTVITSHGSFQGIGSATGLEVLGEPDVQRTIDGATVQSLVRAFGTASLVETGKTYLASDHRDKVAVIAKAGYFGLVTAPI